MAQLYVRTLEMSGYLVNPCGFAPAHRRSSFYSAYANKEFFFYWRQISGVNYLCYKHKVAGVYGLLSSRILVRSGIWKYSLWFDETSGIIHLAYCTEVQNSPLYYRSGTVQADGSIIDRVSSITWGNAVPDGEQIALAAAADYGFFAPSICLDSSNRVYIGYLYRKYTATTWQRPYLIRSPATYGIWATDSGYPYQVSTLGRIDTEVEVCPARDNKLLYVWAYIAAPATIRIRAFDGSSWRNERYSDSFSCAMNSCRLCAVADLLYDDCHIIWSKEDDEVWYMRYDWALDSIAEQMTLSVYDHLESKYPALLYHKTRQRLYCFWQYEIPSASYPDYPPEADGTDVWTLNYKMKPIGSDWGTEQYVGFDYYIGSFFWTSMANFYEDNGCPVLWNMVGYREEGYNFVDITPYTIVEISNIKLNKMEWAALTKVFRVSTSAIAKVNKVSVV